MSATETATQGESGTISTTIKWLAGVNGLLGLWLIAAPFIWSAPVGDLWSDVIVGLLIAGLAGYNYYRELNDRSASQASAALNTLLGIWLLIAPFVLSVNGVLLWNDVLVGALVLLFAGYNWGAADFDISDRSIET